MGNPVGRVQERVLIFLPKFELYVEERLVGEIVKEFTLFRPKFQLNCNGWTVEGDFWEWDYTVMDGARTVMWLSKQIISNERPSLRAVPRITALPSALAE